MESVNAADPEGVVVLRKALAFHASPLRYPGLVRGTTAVPPGMSTLFSVAGGNHEQVDDWADQLEVEPTQLREAARFFIEQVCFQADAPAARVLGLSGRYGSEQVREHYRLLIRLFHPDRNDLTDDWADRFAERVTTAYNALRKSAPSLDQPVSSPPAADPPPASEAPGSMEDGWDTATPPAYSGSDAAATQWLNDLPGIDSVSSPAAPPRWPRAVGLGLLPVAALVGGWVLLVRPHHAAAPPPVAAAPPPVELPPYQHAPALPPAETVDTLGPPAPIPAARVDVAAMAAAVIVDLVDAAVVAPEWDAAVHAVPVSDVPPPAAAVEKADPPAEVADRGASDVIDAYLATASVQVVEQPPPAPAPRAATTRPEPAGRPAAARDPVPLVFEPVPPATPEPPPVLQLDALHRLVGQFRSAYEAGDVPAFSQLFDAQVQTNAGRGKASLERDYRVLFATTDWRRIEVMQVNWQVDGLQAQGRGRLRIRLKPGDGREQIVNSTVHLIATEVAGELRLSTFLFEAGHPSAPTFLSDR